MRSLPEAGDRNRRFRREQAGFAPRQRLSTKSAAVKWTWYKRICPKRSISATTGNSLPGLPPQPPAAQRFDKAKGFLYLTVCPYTACACAFSEQPHDPRKQSCILALILAAPILMPCWFHKAGCWLRPKAPPVRNTWHNPLPRRCRRFSPQRAMPPVAAKLCAWALAPPWRSTPWYKILTKPLALP